jgi:hypothetical protein
MWSATMVLVCVLGMLGRSSAAAPAVVFLDVAPPGVSANAEAFVNRHSKTIYFITSTSVFREALRGNLEALKKVASIYAHEEWHLQHGADERGAYEAQLTALNLLGRGPGTAVYASVVHSMQHVLKAQRQAAQTRLLASRTFDPREP